MRSDTSMGRNGDRSGSRRLSHRHAASVLAALILVVVVGCGGDDSSSSSSASSGGSASATEDLAIAVSVAGTYTAPLYVAQAKGLFEKAGLNVKLDVVGNENLINSLVTERADLGTQGVGLSLAPVKQGKETSVVFALSGNGQAGFFGTAADSDIQSVQDCKQVVTGAKGGASASWVGLYKEALGASYSIRYFADLPTAIALVLSGRADCINLSYSALAEPIETGKLRLLIDPRDRSTVPASVPNVSVEVAMFGMKDNLAAKKSAVTKLMGALNESLEQMKAMSPQEIAAVLRKDQAYEAISQDVLAQQIEGDRNLIAPADGFIPAEGWPDVLRWLKAGQPDLDVDDPTLTYDQRVDMTPWTTANGDAPGS